MRASFLQSSTVCDSAPALIAFGLAILLLGSWWPAVPVVTALSLVALGATFAMVIRLRGPGALRVVFVLHLFAYVSLYSLFVGAVCHSAQTGTQNGITFLNCLDFGAGAAVMIFVVRLSLAAWGGQTAAR